MVKNISSEIIIEFLDEKIEEVSLNSLNPEIKDSINLPKYNKTSLPNDNYLVKIINWVEDVLKKDINIKPADLVEGKFVN